MDEIHIYPELREDDEYETWELLPSDAKTPREQAQWLLHNPGVSWEEMVRWEERRLTEYPEPPEICWGILLPDNVEQMAKELGFPGEEALVSAMLEIYGDPTKLEKDNPILTFRDEFALRPEVVPSTWTKAGWEASRRKHGASQTSE